MSFSTTSPPAQWVNYIEHDVTVGMQSWFGAPSVADSLYVCVSTGSIATNLPSGIARAAFRCLPTRVPAKQRPPPWPGSARSACRIWLLPRPRPYHSCLKLEAIKQRANSRKNHANSSRWVSYAAPPPPLVTAFPGLYRRTQVL